MRTSVVIFSFISETLAGTAAEGVMEVSSETAA